MQVLSETRQVNETWNAKRVKKWPFTNAYKKMIRGAAKLGMNECRNLRAPKSGGFAQHPRRVWPPFLQWRCTSLRRPKIPHPAPHIFPMYRVARRRQAWSPATIGVRYAGSNGTKSEAYCCASEDVEIGGFCRKIKICWSGSNALPWFFVDGPFQVLYPVSFTTKLWDHLESLFTKMGSIRTGLALVGTPTELKALIAGEMTSV